MVNYVNRMRKLKKRTLKQYFSSSSSTTAPTTTIPQCDDTIIENENELIGFVRAMLIIFIFCHIVMVAKGFVLLSFSLFYSTREKREGDLIAATVLMINRAILHKANMNLFYCSKLCMYGISFLRHSFFFSFNHQTNVFSMYSIGGSRF